MSLEFGLNELPKAVWGAPYTATIGISGGEAPYQWTGWLIQEIESLNWQYDPVTESAYKPVFVFVHKLPEKTFSINDSGTLRGNPTFDLTNPPYRWADSKGSVYLFDIQATDATGAFIKQRFSVLCEFNTALFTTPIGGEFG